MRFSILVHYGVTYILVTGVMVYLSFIGNVVRRMQ